MDVHAVAVADRSGHVTFHRVVDLPGWSGLARRTDLLAGAEVTTFEAPLVRLDDVVLPEHPPSLVKIDVEGGELAVVRGASQTLSRYQPTVLFEHGDGSADSSHSDSTELFDVFAGCGLRIFDLDGVGPYSRDQFTRMLRVPVWDWLAVPYR